jgi:hypothetical protein
VDRGRVFDRCGPAREHHSRDGHQGGVSPNQRQYRSG